MVVSTNGSPALSLGLLPGLPPGLLPGLFLGLLLGGCGGEKGASKTGEPSLERPGPLADPALTPEPLLVIQGDPSRVGTVPDVVAVEILSDSGLQIAYTSDSQRETVDPRYVGAQWQHMQSCVGIVAPAPLVVVVAETIEPLLATDDVLRDIDGHITASAGTGAGGIATMQVQEGDFDGSFGNPGFALRSIMGRHLWLSAMLAERDYPFRCARAAADAPGESAPAGIGAVRGQADRPASGFVPSTPDEPVRPPATSPATPPTAVTASASTSPPPGGSVPVAR